MFRRAYTLALKTWYLQPYGLRLDNLYLLLVFYVEMVRSYVLVPVLMPILFLCSSIWSQFDHLWMMRSSKEWRVLPKILHLIWDQGFSGI